MSDKQSREIANSGWSGRAGRIEDAIREAVTAERQAMREIVERILGDRSYSYYRARILAAINAREEDAS